MITGNNKQKRRKEEGLGRFGNPADVEERNLWEQLLAYL